MAFWLATKRQGQESDWLQRFDPRFWTIDFPRPMMASAITPAPDALRIDATFLRQGDLAGLIWASQDTLDHPLLAYATDRDYSRTTLSFRWRSSGVLPLDAVNGPTLTIEGRDASGQPHSWFVRLWNFATGTNEDAQITLPFSQIFGGWDSNTADPLYPSDIDRMFISLVAPGYVQGSTTPFAQALDGWAELTQIRCDGDRAMLPIGNIFVPPHGLAVATAYDDQCNQTPARLIRSLRQLGYRGSVLHYVGMSHHFRLHYAGADCLVDTTGDVLCAPARAWHEAFFAACAEAGLSPIASLSYEVLAQHCPPAWAQRTADGTAGLTGWDPPSNLLSPANAEAMGWLQSVARAYVGLMQTAGVPLRLQIGEPWWWVTGDARICLYDDAAKAAFGGNPVAIPDLRAALNTDQTTLLDQAGALLATSTTAITAAAKAQAGSAACEVLLLTFLPTLLDPAMPEGRRANLPTGWAWPAFDRLQVEDYDWLTAGASALRQAGYATINQRLAYPAHTQDYLAGFVLNSGQPDLWRLIDTGVDEALARGAHEVFVWALPQICRDGYLRIPNAKDTDMNAFDDVPYPLALGLDAKITQEFSTSIATTASGFERRNSLWSNARLHFDLGPGIRSEAELGVLVAFFRARRGAARGFRLGDPSDFSSNGMVDAPTPVDQVIGVGDGTASSFALVKLYGDDAQDQQQRRITRPRAGSVLVSVNGVSVTNGWALGDGGVINFTTPPAAGATVRAGFLFDVPVRFEQDTLDISGAGFAIGDAPSVPVIEIKEAV
jgi:uncharacterized protein (TIGR02217 family)